MRKNLIKQESFEKKAPPCQPFLTTRKITKSAHIRPTFTHAWNLALINVNIDEKIYLILTWSERHSTTGHIVSSFHLLTTAQFISIKQSTNELNSQWCIYWIQLVSTAAAAHVGKEIKFIEYEDVSLCSASRWIYFKWLIEDTTEKI